MYIQVKETPTKGRGVFACSDLPAGILIEEAHVIEIPPEQVALLKATYLFNYYFRWPQKRGAIGLGCASLYNHSFEPNARYVKRISEKLIAFYAIKNIKKNDEITINYNGDPLNKQPVWFEYLP